MSMSMFSTSSQTTASLVTLKAHDVWFFRNSKPFGSGAATSALAETTKLPMPSVVFGAVRTALGETLEGDWRDYRDGTPAGANKRQRLGPPEIDPSDGSTWPASAVRLSGVLPARWSGDWTKAEPLFPVPMFVTVRKATSLEASSDDAETFRLARPSDLNSVGFAGHDSGLKPVLAPTTIRDTPESPFVGKPAAGWLRRDDFVTLACGQTPQGDLTERLIDESEFAEVETRLGIARDNQRRTVQQGMLYQIQVDRWRTISQGDNAPGYGLMARVENADADELATSSAWRLGGESRWAWAAAGRDDSDQPWLDANERGAILDAIRTHRCWWMTLASPAVFESGWRPSWVRPGEGQSSCQAAWPNEADGVPLGHLVGLLLKAPQAQSGWDIVKNHPKPIRRMAPIGAVWFFEFDAAMNDQEVESALTVLDRHIQGRCVADRQAHAGYGLAFVGAWSGSSSSPTDS